MNCRHCMAELTVTFLDLGFAPPSNAYLTIDDLSKPEQYYPLRIKVCEQCLLVQTEDYLRANKLFNSKYNYFSSTSTQWLDHAKNYCDAMITDIGLNQSSYVVEIASNDGYLLKNFIAKGIPCLGIDPSLKTSEKAEALGIPVWTDFFGEAVGNQLAKEGKKADLLIGNNVYAHVPDINDFTRGLKVALKPKGIITLEFPHLLRLIEFNQFDTIYHEHFSYFSLYTVSKIFKTSGLRIWKVEEIPSHGGSLRVYGCHDEDNRLTLNSVSLILSEEFTKGLQNIKTYQFFQKKTDYIKNNFLYFLITQKKLGKSIAAYGAAAKGNTLLNYAGVKTDLLPFVCDAAAEKQNMYLPGSHLPIYSPNILEEKKLDFLVLLPWNLLSEIRNQLAHIEKKGTHFVTVIPKLNIF